MPEWFARLDPDDIVLERDPKDGPCMADAEDGEQPWESRPFAFVGPPETDDAPGDELSEAAAA